jgi:hypothetical protein
LESSDSGAPFSMSLLPTAVGGNDNPDGTRTKYVSLNKVTVNMSGTRDKLFVVRDLSSMVSLQKIMYTKQHLNTFTEKIVRQI